VSFISVVEYGIVIRRKELLFKFIDVDRLSAVLEFDAPLDISDDLVSFGPCFGGEATDELTRRLEALGLKYVDDFFVFSGEFPLWCKFKVGINSD
jgi:surfactin synthase thioesterase subunit